jgi:hypothetical protein
MVWADIAIGVGMALTAGAAAYSTSTQAGIAGKQLSLADQQMAKQNQAFQQLQDLISNPASFFSSPVYKSAADQGSQAVARQNAAQFGPNSGNEASALQAFGQSFGQQQLLSQEQLLAGMSGTGFNPSGALTGASGAASSAAGSLASLGGLMAFFGSGTSPAGTTASGNAAMNSAGTAAGFTNSGGFLATDAATSSLVTDVPQ